MEQMLDLQNSKCYKIGAKDLVTRDNDFEMATGNASGVVGYVFYFFRMLIYSSAISTIVAWILSVNGKNWKSKDDKNRILGIVTNHLQ